MTKRWLLFDIDGTIMDSGGAGRIALVQAFEAVFDVQDMDAASRRVRYGGRTDPLILADLAREAQLDLALLAERLVELERHYLIALKSALASQQAAPRALPGVTELLQELSESPQEPALGLVTGNIEHGARLKLDRLHLNRFFATGGFGSDHADRTHVARIGLERLSQRSGSPAAPRDVWVIGDTVHDIACARANGFRCLAVGTGSDPVATLHAAQPDALFEDLSDSDLVIERLLG